MKSICLISKPSKKRAGKALFWCWVDYIRGKHYVWFWPKFLLTKLLEHFDCIFIDDSLCPQLADGLILEKTSSPLGVLLIVFESRPDALVQVK